MSNELPRRRLVRRSTATPAQRAHQLLVAGYSDPIRVFVSFDYSQMLFEARALAQQLRRSPRFNVHDWSMKEAARESSWKAAARRRISRADVMVIVVNGHTWGAKGVLAEVDIARELGVPIRMVYPARFPRPAKVPAPGAPLNPWTHDNLERLLAVPRRRAA